MWLKILTNNILQCLDVLCKLIDEFDFICDFVNVLLSNWSPFKIFFFIFPGQTGGTSPLKGMSRSPATISLPVLLLTNMQQLTIQTLTREKKFVYKYLQSCHIYSVYMYLQIRRFPFARINDACEFTQPDTLTSKMECMHLMQVYKCRAINFIFIS